MKPSIPQDALTYERAAQTLAQEILNRCEPRVVQVEVELRVKFDDGRVWAVWRPAMRGSEVT